MAERNHADNPSFSAQRFDFELKRAALAHEGREAGEHFRQIAASLALHADGGDEEQQIILADTTVQVDDGCRDILTEGNFLGGHGEFGRIGSRISLAARLMALTNGWPIRKLRTMMLSASGSWAVKLSIRRRRTIAR